MTRKYFNPDGKLVDADAISSALESIKPTPLGRQSFASAGDFTYTPSVGATVAKVYMTGGGANGTALSNGSPGGGSAATAIFEITVDHGTPMTGHVGAAQSSTTFASKTVAGASGAGPGSVPSISGALIIHGEAGAMGHAMDFSAFTSWNDFTGTSTPSSFFSTDYKLYVSGNGGRSFWGGGGIGSVVSSATKTGSGASTASAAAVVWSPGALGSADAPSPGAGGAGACNGGSAGNGAAGCVVIEEY